MKAIEQRYEQCPRSSGWLRRHFGRPAIIAIVSGFIAVGLLPAAFGQSIYTPVAITTFAGQTTSGTANGLGTNAQFSSPFGVAVDSAGNVYVADSGNLIIRKATPDGLVTTLAGSGAAGTNNGTGENAQFIGPLALAVDAARNVYVADPYAIRKVTPAGVVTTLAGDGFTSGTNDGTGSQARFNQIQGIALDAATNIYVTDYSNHTLRRVTPAGVVTTLAGKAGTYGANDGTNGSARFNNPVGLAADAAGNLYVADSVNKLIRKVSPQGTNWVVTTIAGTNGFGIPFDADGTNGAAHFLSPTGIAVDTATNLYVTDVALSTLRRISPSGTNWVVTTLAGTTLTQGSNDGVGAAALFNGPSGVAVDGAANLYVADTDNHKIRKSVILWTNTAGGNWSNPTNWSSAAVPKNGASVALISSGTYTVNLDTNATIATLVIGAASGRQTLALTNGGAYKGTGGTVIGGAVGATGAVSVATGSFTATNFPVLIGPVGAGQMIISGGTVTMGDVKLGGASTNSSGELDLLTGGHLKILFSLSGNLIVIDGGDLDGTSGQVVIGEDHDSTMSVRNGNVANVGTLFVGFSPGFTGTLTQTGGTVSVSSSVIVGNNLSNATGAVTMSGGAMYITNASHDATLHIHQGTFALNGGTLVVDRLIATNGSTGGFTRTGGTLICGQFEQAGGGVTVTTNLVVGEDANDPGGFVSLGGGSKLYVTNLAHNAIMEVRNGTFVLEPGGTLVVDTLVLTNAAGHFVRNGGTLQAATLVLAPNLDADGDTQSNTNELRAGTDPLDPNSLFAMVNVVRTNSQDIRLDWTAVGGHSYIVQRAPAILGGPGAFVDLSPVINVGGTGSGATNYVHRGAVTNGPGFYRVRLAP